MPPIVFWVLGAVGALAAAKWIAGEARRINAELYSDPRDALADRHEPETFTHLRRDPASGVYRPERRSGAA